MKTGKSDPAASARPRPADGERLPEILAAAPANGGY